VLGLGKLRDPCPDRRPQGVIGIAVPRNERTEGVAESLMVGSQRAQLRQRVDRRRLGSVDAADRDQAGEGPCGAVEVACGDQRPSGGELR
jgi:hypothetical protein